MKKSHKLVSEDKGGMEQDAEQQQWSRHRNSHTDTQRVSTGMLTS